MRRLSIGRVPEPGPDFEKRLYEFLVHLVSEVEEANQINDRSTVDSYTVNNYDGTGTRTIDFASATAATVRETLATLVRDLKKRTILR